MKAENSRFAIRHLSYSYFERERGDIIYEECVKELEELETKATAYDSQSVQNAIECDRIKKRLIQKFVLLKVKTNYLGVIVEFKSCKGKERHEGSTELEALTKALEWAEGENNR